MSDFLKGNFKVKKDVKESEESTDQSKKDSIKDELRKAALASIGGSMVYVERTDLEWDGEEEESKE